MDQGFLCCIYGPTLVESHQSMWKIEPNVNPFFTTDNNNNMQTTTTTFTDNRRQSGPYVSFLLRQTTQKPRKTRNQHSTDDAEGEGEGRGGGGEGRGEQGRGRAEEGNGGMDEED